MKPKQPNNPYQMSETEVRERIIALESIFINLVTELQAYGIPVTDDSKTLKGARQVSNQETTLHNTSDLKRIAELENALKQTNDELSGAIDEVNDYLDDAGHDMWDKETCHNNQVLLEGQGK